MPKSEIEPKLNTAKNNYVLGLAAVSLFATPEAYPILEKHSASFGKYSVSFDQVARLLRNSDDRDIAVKEFLKSQIRALIKESFELIKDYCADTGQTGALEAEPWFQFARMIRNCLSHNFKFEFNPHDKSLLPVSWGPRTIEIGMDGTHLELKFFGYVETWELFQEYQGFVRERLA